jgi:hypothetical protein
MPNGKDFIPARDADFDVYFKNIKETVAAKTAGTKPEWTHIPPADKTALDAAYTNWSNAYIPTLKPHTPEQTREKNRVRKSSEKLLRKFINRFLRHEPVTDKERDGLSIRNPKPGRTVIPVPATIPQFAIRVRNVRRLDVDFQDEGSATKARPYGYDGAIIYWDVLDAPPAQPEDLRQSHKATRTPYTLKFKETERAKKAYVALRWQNSKGEKGSWTTIQEAVVP